MPLILDNDKRIIVITMKSTLLMWNFKNSKTRPTQINVIRSIRSRSGILMILKNTENRPNTKSLWITVMLSIRWMVCLHKYDNSVFIGAVHWECVHNISSPRWNNSILHAASLVHIDGRDHKVRDSWRLRHQLRLLSGRF